MNLVNHTRSTEESLMSPEEAREHLRKDRSRRKFRVEGTRAGNSRFVTLKTAERIRDRLGGAIVNYRPFQPSKHRAAARMLGHCPVCRVRAGSPCRVGLSSIIRKPHAKRVKKGKA